MPSQTWSAHQAEANGKEDVHVSGVLHRKELRREEAEHHGQQGRKQQHGPTAVPFGRKAANNDERREEEHRRELELEVVGLGKAKVLDAVRERPGSQQVEQGVGDAHGAGSKHNPLPVLHQFVKRALDNAVLLDGLLEDGGLAHVLTHKQANHHEHRRKQERYAPAPGNHGLGREPLLKQQVHAVRAEEPQRRAQVGEGPPQRALVGGSVLGCHQRGTRPLAGKAQALACAAQAKQHYRHGPRTIPQRSQTQAASLGTGSASPRW